MTGGSKDWDRELSKIDRQLESLSDEELIPGGRTPATPAGPGSVVEERLRTTTLGVFSRLFLAVALGVGILFWPYASRCGFGLAAYLVAVGMIITSGAWSAIWTWRHRAGRGHTLSLLLILWGIVLLAQELLPRIGYAKLVLPWGCE